MSPVTSQAYSFLGHKYGQNRVGLESPRDFAGSRHIPWYSIGTGEYVLHVVHWT